MSAPIQPAAAALAFGLIRHARLKPARHVFGYQGLFLRLPMASGFADHGRWFSRNRAAFLGFKDRDHGAGGPDALAWLRGLLHDSAITDVDGEIWLHTFARMFGMVFKPVSFWYCQRHDGSLRAVVVEVNNTFGERHCYVLENRDASGQAHAIKPGQTLHAVKALHVSPFNPVAGRYEFKFVLRPDRSLARIDYFDDAGGVLVTSIAGSYQAITPANVLRALRMTPWFSLGVLVRIHWQALQLWRKKIPFHRKPAAPTKPYTLSRYATQPPVQFSAPKVVDEHRNH